MRDIVVSYYSVNVGLAFPREWGDISFVVNVRYGVTIYDHVYSKVVEYINVLNDVGNFPIITDITKGYDYGEIVLSVGVGDSFENVHVVVGFITSEMYRVYMSIPSRKRKLARGLINA